MFPDVGNATVVVCNSGTGLSVEEGVRLSVLQGAALLVIPAIYDGRVAQAAIEAVASGVTVWAGVRRRVPRIKSIGERWVEIGMDWETTRPLLRGMIGKQLQRILCGACKVARPLTEEKKSWLDRVDVAVPEVVYNAKGCDRCCSWKSGAG